MTDWQQIRSECEQGASQKSLAAKYHITQQAISKRALKEGWVVSPQGIVVSPTTDQPDLVDQALADLAIHLTDHPEEAKLELKEHKLFADAFSQYMKAKLLFPTEQEIHDGLVIPYHHLSARARMEIQRILMEDEQRKERLG